jgi:hypothetical protein
VIHTRSATLGDAAALAELILLTGFDNAGAQAFYRALGYGDYALALRRPIGP